MTRHPWTRADDDALDALLALTAADPYATTIPVPQNHAGGRCGCSGRGLFVAR